MEGAGVGLNHEWTRMGTNESQRCGGKTTNGSKGQEGAGWNHESTRMDTNESQRCGGELRIGRNGREWKEQGRVGTTNRKEGAGM